MKQTALAAALVAWLNVYLIRQAFFLHFSGYANAMHGFWITLASVPYADWLLPSWWPRWDGGMPLEFTYAPLVPWILRALTLAGLDVFRAWHVLAGAVFVLVPVALVVRARRLDVSWPVACAAGMVYSLYAFSELLTPETQWGQVTRAQRMQLIFVWDDVPHMLAIGLFLLGWRPLAMLANAFGLVLVTFETLFDWRQHWRTAIACFVLVSPWWPPSLVAAIQRNAEGGFSWLALVVTLGPALWLARRNQWAAFTWTFALILLLERYAALHFAPQPMRYVLEFSVALVLLLATLADRLPRKAWILPVVALIAIPTVIQQRRFAKSTLREVPMEATFEYQLAQKLRDVEQPVFLPGSAAAWVNAFAPVRQAGGGSFSTAYDPARQHMLEVAHGRVPNEDPVAALQRFGVRTVVVSLKEGREFWKPFPNPNMYEGKLPLLWRDDDVAVYSVPNAATLPPGQRKSPLEDWGTRAASLLALIWLCSCGRRL